MEIQTLINTIVPLICATIGWFCKELWIAVQELKDDLSDLRADIPKLYVTKADFNNQWAECMKALHRIEDKLDNKVDK